MTLFSAPVRGRGRAPHEKWSRICDAERFSIPIHSVGLKKVDFGCREDDNLTHGVPSVFPVYGKC